MGQASFLRFGARLVLTVGMTWGTPRSYGRNIDVGLECLGTRLVPTVGTLTCGLNALRRLVPTVGMTWGTSRSYGRNDLEHASFLR